MFRVSNTLIGLLNLLTLIISATFISAALYLRDHGHTECQLFLQPILLGFGSGLFLLSLLGFIGACCRISAALCIYLLLVSLLIVTLSIFTVFAFIVTNEGAGRAVSVGGFKEYRLGDYSHWLQDNVVNGEHWGKFKSCFASSHFCFLLALRYPTREEFYKKKLSPIQSGCCKPPTYCGFTFKNATFWEVPPSGPEAPDSDCLTWNNQQETLCYDCKSCKAGVLANIKNEWKKLAVVNISIILFLCIVHCIGSCAYQGNKADKYRYRGGYY